MPTMPWPLRLFGRSPSRRRVDMATFAPVPEGGVLVGGALRDVLLGRDFADLDWLVEDPEAAARRTADELGGGVFGLDPERGHWRVVTGSTTRDYIRQGGSLESNLRGRDFTVNAMAADAQGRLIDPLQGARDLARGQLRMVGEANLRDDPLRALRAVRLAVQLGFRIEDATVGALKRVARAQQDGGLPRPAWERVGDELDKLMEQEGAARGFRLMHDLGLMRVYLSELERCRGVEQGGFHHLDVLGHSLEALNQLLQGFPEAGAALRWATLLHDVGKPETKSWDESGRYFHFYGHDKLGGELTKRLLERLRRPSERVRRATLLVRYHMLPLPKNAREARRFTHRRREILPDLLKLMIADREAARGPLSSESNRRAYRLALARILEILAEPPKPKPLLDGREVMAHLGLEPGPRVGEAVRFVREAEAVGDVSTKAEAEAALETFAQGQGWLQDDKS